MKVLGIDVGLTGALVLLQGDGIGGCWDMPTVAKKGSPKSRVLDVVGLARIMRDLVGVVDVVVIEQQGAAPGQGLGSTFKLGWQAGVIEGLARGNGLRVELVRPNVWKAGMRLSGDKEQSRQAALALWPVSATPLMTRKKDHGRAEAALLARWWMQVDWLSRKAKDAAPRAHAREAGEVENG